MLLISFSQLEKSTVDVIALLIYSLYQPYQGYKIIHIPYESF